MQKLHVGGIHPDWTLRIKNTTHWLLNMTLRTDQVSNSAMNWGTNCKVNHLFEGLKITQRTLITGTNLQGEMFILTFQWLKHNNRREKGFICTHVHPNSTDNSKQFGTNKTNNKLTNYMEQSPSWEANNSMYYWLDWSCYRKLLSDLWTC
jgi:hypothetical protein